MINKKLSKNLIKTVGVLLSLTSFFSMAANFEKSMPSEVVTSGSLETYKNVQSKFIKERRVQVWLPDGYSADKKYAVLYMHDGQMLFDASVNWNGQEWGVDEVAGALAKKSNIRPFIVVGVDNGGSELRHSEYFPQKPFESISEKEKQKIYKSVRSNGQSVFSFEVKSDAYLSFLVTELKPFIDSQYSVYTNTENTFVMGSSMGGLISMYAMQEYPSVFGGAACLSTHWPGITSMKDNPVPKAFNNYLKAHLGNITDHKLYFDYGDQTLDAMYPPLQKEVDNIMAGYNVSEALWQTQFFKGEEHSEKSWNKRLDIPMTFLLEK